MDFGSWILNFGIWHLAVGIWIPDFGSWIINIQYYSKPARKPKHAHQQHLPVSLRLLPSVPLSLLPLSICLLLLSLHTSVHTMPDALSTRCTSYEMPIVPGDVKIVRLLLHPCSAQPVPNIGLLLRSMRIPLSVGEHVLLVLHPHPRDHEADLALFPASSQVGCPQ